MNVLFVSAEVFPFAKTGGLADVAGSLPKALRARGHDLRVAMPYYRHVQRYFARGEKDQPELKPAVTAVQVPLAGSTIACPVGQTFLPGTDVPVYLLAHEPSFDRAEIYGEGGKDYPDSARRFSLFCRGVLALPAALNWEPDVIHCHDWHTGLIPLYLRHGLAPRRATAFTIHNLAYQGLFPLKHWAVTGVPPNSPAYDTLIAWGKLNFMKAGIANADCLSTVSEGYAREIQTEEFGCGLEGLLRSRREDLFGILNGIDYTEWNPATDEAIAARYSADDLSGKRVCKRALQREYGLPEREDVPLLGLVSRLDRQKGLDLIAEIAEDLMGLDLQFVMLGTGDPKYHQLFRRLSARYPQRAGINLSYNATLAKRIYAGSDLFLMPSYYEPCGLGQMISLAYGTIPIVRATGGLADTIHETGDAPQNGFVFEKYEAGEFLAAIQRALAAYRDRDRWPTLIRNGMACDFSWEASARRYEELYETSWRQAREPGPSAPS